MDPKRLNESDLISESIRVANDELNKERISEKQVAEKFVNGYAHGFYMGARFAEKMYTPKWFRKKEPPMSDPALLLESYKAANSYVARKLPGLIEKDRAEVITPVARGFRSGLRYREGIS